MVNGKSVLGYWSGKLQSGSNSFRRYEQIKKRTGPIQNAIFEAICSFNLFETFPTEVWNLTLKYIFSKGALSKDIVTGTTGTTQTADNSPSNCVNYTQDHVRSSSVFNCETTHYGPENALDGILMRTDKFNGFVLVTESYFRSSPDDHCPWLEIHYIDTVSVAMVMLTTIYNNNNNNNNMRIQNIKIHVGNTPASTGQLSSNELCAELDNSVIELNSFKVLTCGKVKSGRYLLIQMQDSNNRSGMSIQEVVVFHQLNATIDFNGTGNQSQAFTYVACQYKS